MRRIMQRLEDFDEAARNWGWQSDQGVGRPVVAAEKAYVETKRALMVSIANLEGDSRRLRKKIKAASVASGET